jgi:hypothetical protein
MFYLSRQKNANMRILVVVATEMEARPLISEFGIFV